MRKVLPIVLCFLVAVLAGCAGNPERLTSDQQAGQIPLATDVPSLFNLTVARGTPLVFEESVVSAAVSLASDLYEPTMEVSPNGTIFITGHTAVVDTTGAPVYGSWDDGKTWSQLPFTRDLRMPGDAPGATPPITDEIFLVAGDDGWLYGVDITLFTFPVNAWSEDGRMHSYFNPNAYDEYQVALQASECAATPLKDRPWAAYGGGKLLMVSNPAAGPAQIGVLDVPSGPAGLVPAPYGVGATTGGGRWNVCAGVGYHSADNAIPGIPDMRPDGLFAVPQLGGGSLGGTRYLYLITGNANHIFDVDVHSVFPSTSGGEITSRYGQAAFDAAGDLFVGVTENVRVNESDPQNLNRTGQLHFAVSTDDATTFQDRVFVTGPGAVRHFYMDGNRFGPGAFVVWAVDGNTTDDEGNVTAYDWYAAHAYVSSDGNPVLENVSLIIDEGPQPSAHVTGAALGPDGRGYTAMYTEGATPLSVYVQRSGPAMPVWGKE